MEVQWRSQRNRRKTGGMWLGNLPLAECVMQHLQLPGFAIHLHAHHHSVCIAGRVHLSSQPQHRIADVQYITAPCGAILSERQSTLSTSLTLDSALHISSTPAAAVFVETSHTSQQWLLDYTCQLRKAGWCFKSRKEASLGISLIKAESCQSRTSRGSTAGQLDDASTQCAQHGTS